MTLTARAGNSVSDYKLSVWCVERNVCVVTLRWEAFGFLLPALLSFGVFATTFSSATSILVLLSRQLFTPHNSHHISLFFVWFAPRGGGDVFSQKKQKSVPPFTPPLSVLKASQASLKRSPSKTSATHLSSPPPSFCALCTQNARRYHPPSKHS